MKSKKKKFSLPFWVLFALILFSGNILESADKYYHNYYKVFPGDIFSRESGGSGSGSVYVWTEVSGWNVRIGGWSFDHIVDTSSSYDLPMVLRMK